MDNGITPSYEIGQRISAVQKGIQAAGMDALFIAQRIDLFYFSGTAQSGYLFIPAQGEPLLLIKKYLPRAEKETSVKNITGINSVKEVPGKIQDFYGRLPAIMGIEFDVMPVREFHFLKDLFRIKDYKDASELIHNVRMIKSEWEIAQMEHTAMLSHKTFQFIERELRPGLSEIEFAGLYETYARSIGHQARLRTRDYKNEGYNWHILSGESGGTLGLLDAPASGEGTSPSFPVGGGRKIIKENEPVMIDTGFVYNGYHIDETRMFAIGSMPDKAMKASEAAIEIQNAILEKAAPGVAIEEVYEHSLKKAASLGYEKQYLGPEGHKVVFIGHGIGLELVEPPFLAHKRNDPLKPGMVFSTEPKLVFMNEFSAGIESVFQVTETGTKLISRVPAKIFIKK
ncbi:MAG: aminopeptidase P family protein [Spirochaetes bacterium]|nr:aminopeptidase P family protein [Spirochaetota bacterium]